MQPQIKTSAVTSFDLIPTAFPLDDTFGDVPPSDGWEYRRWIRVKEGDDARELEQKIIEKSKEHIHIIKMDFEKY